MPPNSTLQHSIKSVALLIEEAPATSTVAEALLGHLQSALLDRHAKVTVTGVAEKHESIKELDFDALVVFGRISRAPHKKNAIIRQFHNVLKPIAAVGLSSLSIAESLHGESLELAYVDDKDSAAYLQSMGAITVMCAVDDFVSDRDHKILSTPSDQRHESIILLGAGIRRMIAELIEMA